MKTNDSITTIATVQKAGQRFNQHFPTNSTERRWLKSPSRNTV